MDKTHAEIEAALDEIRPAIQFDGGDVKFVSFDDATGIATVELAGACVGCGMSTMTLSAGIERIVKERVPQVQAVRNAAA